MVCLRGRCAIHSHVVLEDPLELCTELLGSPPWLLGLGKADEVGDGHLYGLILAPLGTIADVHITWKEQSAGPR